MTRAWVIQNKTKNYKTLCLHQCLTLSCWKSWPNKWSGNYNFLKKMKLSNLIQDEVKSSIPIKESSISEDRISSFYKGISTDGKVTLSTN